MKRHLIFSCEHGGNLIPQDYQDLFRGHEELLKSHLGYDPGALELAKELAAYFSAPLFHSTTSRLLVELNRSLTNKSLFSEITDKGLSQKQKEAVIYNHYLPYREKIEQYIKEKITSQPILHLSIHTFTPVLNQKERKADIGLLYDPQHQPETAFCQTWFQKMQKESKDAVQVRKNYPYKGISDGLTTHLRSLYNEKDYVGIELEVNQKFPLTLRNEWPSIKQLVIHSLAAALKEAN